MNLTEFIVVSITCVLALFAAFLAIRLLGQTTFAMYENTKLRDSISAKSLECSALQIALDSRELQVRNFGIEVSTREYQIGILTKSVEEYVSFVNTIKSEVLSIRNQLDEVNKSCSRQLQEHHNLFTKHYHCWKENLILERAKLLYIRNNLGNYGTNLLQQYEDMSDDEKQVLLGNALDSLSLDQQKSPEEWLKSIQEIVPVEPPSVTLEFSNIPTPTQSPAEITLPSPELLTGPS